MRTILRQKVDLKANSTQTPVQELRTKANHHLSLGHQRPDQDLTHNSQVLYSELYLQHPFPIFFSFFFLETRSHKVAQGGLGLLGRGISGLCHLAQWSSFSPILENEDPFRCVPHSYNPRNQRTEAERLWVQGQAGLQTLAASMSYTPNP